MTSETRDLGLSSPFMKSLGRSTANVRQLIRDRSRVREEVPHNPVKCQVLETVTGPMKEMNRSITELARELHQLRMRINQFEDLKLSEISQAPGDVSLGRLLASKKPAPAAAV